MSETRANSIISEQFEANQAKYCGVRLTDVVHLWTKNESVRIVPERYGKASAN